MRRLMTEVEALDRAPAGAATPTASRRERLTYAEALRRHAGVDAHAASERDLERAAAAHGIDCKADLDRDAKLDLLMGLVVGPKLGRERPCFICDYPASQASLARLEAGAAAGGGALRALPGRHRARERLSRAQRCRRAARRDSPAISRCAARAGKSQPPIDERLLAALEVGIPDCAGVALGFDRLVAIAVGATHLSQAMAFPIDSA